MPNLKSAVLRLCTLAIPWPTDAAAALGGSEVAGARIYLANIAKDGVVRRVGPDSWQAGDPQAIAQLKAKKSRAHFGGNSTAYRLFRKTWDELEAKDREEGRKLGVLTSQKGTNVDKRGHQPPADEPEATPMTSPAQPMTSIPAVVAVTGFTGKTVHRWIKAGKIPGAVKIVGRWRVPVSWLCQITIPKGTTP